MWAHDADVFARGGEARLCAVAGANEVVGSKFVGIMPLPDAPQVSDEGSL